MTNAERDKDMIESIELWLHEIEPKWVEKELAWLDKLRTRLIEEKSEKPMNQEDLEEEIAIWIPEHITGGESGVWKECREAVTEWARIVARHFAEWQREHSFKPTQEQLNALDNVYKTHGADSACRHIILNLLNQLKELL